MKSSSFVPVGHDEDFSPRRAEFGIYIPVIGEVGRIEETQVAVQRVPDHAGYLTVEQRQRRSAGSKVVVIQPQVVASFAVLVVADVVVAPQIRTGREIRVVTFDPGIPGNPPPAKQDIARVCPAQRSVGKDDVVQNVEIVNVGF